MNIIFLGEDSFSAAVLKSLIDNNYKILAVFSPIYNNNNHARLEYLCKVHNIKYERVSNINSIDCQIAMASLNPDLICVCHFEKILKKNILDIPKLGSINLHPSLLPKYKGLSPQHWPVINGDNETGITIHFIDENIDTGDIIIQEKIPLSGNEYISELQLKMIPLYKKSYLSALNTFKSEKKTIKPQNPISGSYFGRLSREHREIKLELGCRNAYNLIRAVSSPYQGAYYSDITIWRANIMSQTELNSITIKTIDDGIHLNTPFGPIIKFYDGILIIEKYSKNET